MEDDVAFVAVGEGASPCRHDEEDHRGKDELCVALRRREAEGVNREREVRDHTELEGVEEGREIPVHRSPLGDGEASSRGRAGRRPARPSG